MSVRARVICPCDRICQIARRITLTILHLRLVLMTIYWLNSQLWLKIKARTPLTGMCSGSLNDRMGALPFRISRGTTWLGQSLRCNAPVWYVLTARPHASHRVLLFYALLVGRGHRVCVRMLQFVTERMAACLSSGACWEDVSGVISDW